VLVRAGVSSIVAEKQGFDNDLLGFPGCLVRRIIYLATEFSPASLL
jgi:hypothetical protein